MIWQGRDFARGVSGLTWVGGTSSGAGPTLPELLAQSFPKQSCRSGACAAPLWARSLLLSPQHRKEWAVSSGARPRHPAPEAHLKRSNSTLQQVRDKSPTSRHLQEVLRCRDSEWTLWTAEGTVGKECKNPLLVKNCMVNGKPPQEPGLNLAGNGAR